MRRMIISSIAFVVSVSMAACGGDVSSSPISPADAASAQARAQGQRSASLPFRGSITTADQATVVGPNLLLVGTAEGTATHLGRYTATFEVVAPLGASTATGTYRFTAANGDQLIATFAGYATPVSPGVERFTEALTIVGGTGRFAAATGTFTMSKLVNIDYQSATSTGAGSFEGTIDLNR